MEQIKLFKLRKKIITIAIGLIGLIITLLYILTLFTEYGLRGNFSFIGVILLIQMILQYRNFNKFYIHFNKHQIKWNFPGMNEPKIVDLSSTSFEISKNWKGVILSNDNQKIDISTNGLWDRDINLIYHKLKEYYT